MMFPWVGEVRRLSCLCVVGFEGPTDGMGLVVAGCLKVVGIVEVVGPEMAADKVVVVVVAAEVDDVDDVGLLVELAVSWDDCGLDVVGADGQVVWCSRSGSCGCLADAASSW